MNEQSTNVDRNFELESLIAKLVKVVQREIGCELDASEIAMFFMGVDPDVTIELAHLVVALARPQRPGATPRFEFAAEFAERWIRNSRKQRTDWYDVFDAWKKANPGDGSVRTPNHLREIWRRFFGDRRSLFRR